MVMYFGLINFNKIGRVTSDFFDTYSQQDSEIRLGHLFYLNWIYEAILWWRLHVHCQVMKCPKGLLRFGTQFYDLRVLHIIVEYVERWTWTKIPSFDSVFNLIYRRSLPITIIANMVRVAIYRCQIYLYWALHSVISKATKLEGFLN